MHQASPGFSRADRDRWWIGPWESNGWFGGFSGGGGRGVGGELLIEGEAFLDGGGGHLLEHRRTFRNQNAIV